MIGYLEGKPKLLTNSLLVVTAGVGYEVKMAGHILSKLSKLDQVQLFIYTHVREDRLELYGFETIEEKQLFVLLLNVSGVGPGTALTISASGHEALVSAVQEGTVSFFTAIPRVGKKMAQKIIIDLGSKLGTLKTLQLGTQVGRAEELIQSLVGLGFNEVAARDVITSLDLDSSGDEALLKTAIKKLSKS